MLSFSIGAMIIWFLLMPFVKSRRRRKENTNINIKSVSIARTAPSIAYNTSNGYVSAPKEFVINRYMEGEKIKKAC